jgi:hypothetical protein
VFRPSCLVSLGHSADVYILEYITRLSLKPNKPSRAFLFGQLTYDAEEVFHSRLRGLDMHHETRAAEEEWFRESRASLANLIEGDAERGGVVENLWRNE